MSVTKGVSMIEHSGDWHLCSSGWEEGNEQDQFGKMVSVYSICLPAYLSRNVLRIAYVRS